MEIIFLMIFHSFFVFRKVPCRGVIFPERDFFCISIKDKCISLRFFESSENVKYLNASLIT